MLNEIKQSEFNKIYDIMKESFPFDEIRSFEHQQSLFSRENYKILTLNNCDEILGFVAIWDFEKFLFLEHFAVSTNHRNSGLGNKILKELKNYTNKKIILEVEYPENDIANRRINFYKRHGFMLFDFNYVMPAYTENHKPVPLCLMSTAELNQEDYDDFNDKIIHIVNA